MTQRLTHRPPGAFQGWSQRGYLDILPETEFPELDSDPDDGPYAFAPGCRQVPSAPHDE